MPRGYEALPPVPTDAAGASVRLLDGFALLASGDAVEVAPGSQRLLAYLALRERPAPRSLVAGRLWPEASEEGSLARLRSALWRMRQSSDLIVEVRGGNMQLASTIVVDVRELLARVGRLLDANCPLAPADEDHRTLTGELLPDWWDDWVVVERERLRQLCLHALEALAARLASGRRFARALEVALAAIAVEPLRESPHRSLIRIHLAEGNRSEALRAYESYRALLCAELGVVPSPRMKALVASLSEGDPDLRVR